MSQFSGKCDVYDTLIEIHGITDDYDWSKLELVLNNERLDIKSVKDLMLYAPYLIAMSFSNQEVFHARLSPKSFIDIEEEDTLMWRFKWVAQHYRKCRRKKIEFVPEEVAKTMSTGYAYESYLEICRRVKEHPTKINLEGLHTSIADYYRKNWYNALIFYGYSEEFSKNWCYSR